MKRKRKATFLWNIFKRGKCLVGIVRIFIRIKFSHTLCVSPATVILLFSGFSSFTFGIQKALLSSHFCPLWCHWNMSFVSPCWKIPRHSSFVNVSRDTSIIFCYCAELFKVNPRLPYLWRREQDEASRNLTKFPFTAVRVPIHGLPTTWAMLCKMHTGKRNWATWLGWKAF